MHTHLPEAAWYGLPAGWLAGVPVRISHLQNCYWHWPTKLRLLDKSTSVFATKSVACSEAVRRFYRKKMWYCGSAIHVIHNSVDLKRFQGLPGRIEARRLLGVPDDALLTSCVASFDEQKGHVYLLDAMFRVRAAAPKALLLLVGEGSLRRKCEHDVESGGLAGSVRFLGRRTDIPLILAASDLFVLPSLWEGLPLVVAEAGAASLPVVATRVDGTPEIVRDGITGLLIPPKHSELLAEAIVMLLQDSARREQMGKKARNVVKEQFNMNKIAERIETLYLDLLCNREEHTLSGLLRNRRTDYV
jgi:glycosyltransferase involved in cell wall biosynthesis